MIEKELLWQQILSELQKKISPAGFKTWFSGTSILEIKENLIEIGCTNNFKKEWLEKYYQEEIIVIVFNLLQKSYQISFKIKFNEIKKIRNEEAGPLFENFYESKKTSGYYNGLNPAYTFSKFVVGRSNNLAYAATLSIVQNPSSSYNPLFLYGPVAVGKTHLMQAAGNAILEKNPQARILYFPIEKFTNDFIESLSSKKTSLFREKYRKADVLLVDDVQFLSGKEAVQEEFFHTFNELHMAGKQIMLSSDRKPQEIAKLEDRLSSRFMGGLMVDIGEPDFEMRVAILKTKVAKFDITPSDEVLNYLATAIQTNTRELEGALFKILTLTKAFNEPLTVNLVKKALGESDSLTTSSLLIKTSPKQVLSIACRHFKIKLSDILGPRREQNLVIPRQIIMYILRKEMGIPLEKVGQILGNRDHTTIMHGVEKIENSFLNNTQIREDIMLIKRALWG